MQQVFTTTAAKTLNPDEWLARARRHCAKIVNELATHIEAAVKSPDIIKKMETLGLTPIGNTAKAFAETINHDLAMWSEAVKISGAKAE